MHMTPNKLVRKKEGECVLLVDCASELRYRTTVNLVAQYESSTHTLVVSGPGIGGELLVLAAASTRRSCRQLGAPALPPASRTGWRTRRRASSSARTAPARVPGTRRGRGARGDRRSRSPQGFGRRTLVFSAFIIRRF